MAFNPPINSAGQPMRLEGEYMVLLRKNIEIEIKIDNASGEKKAKGKVNLSILISFTQFLSAFYHNSSHGFCRR